MNNQSCSKKSRMAVCLGRVLISVIGFGFILPCFANSEGMQIDKIAQNLPNPNLASLVEIAAGFLGLLVMIGLLYFNPLRYRKKKMVLAPAYLGSLDIVFDILDPIDQECLSLVVFTCTSLQSYLLDTKVGSNFSAYLLFEISDLLSRALNFLFGSLETASDKKRFDYGSSHLQKNRLLTDEVVNE